MVSHHPTFGSDDGEVALGPLPEVFLQGTRSNAAAVQGLVERLYGRPIRRKQALRQDYLGAGVARGSGAGVAAGVAAGDAATFGSFWGP